jgi:hypothetical protein
MADPTQKDPYQKNCIHCKKSFSARRTNMEYCGPDCKKKANNGIARNERVTISKIDRKLKLNWRILNQVLNDGKKELSLAVLQANGFDYTKHTERLQDKPDGTIVLICYNYCIEILKDKTCKIKKLW